MYEGYMWEIGIATRKNNFLLLNDFDSVLKNYIKDDNLMKTQYEKSGFSYILFACKKNHSTSFFSNIKKALIEFITEKYKFEFITENMPIKTDNDFYLKSYIKVLTYFDKEEDEFFLNKKILLSSTIYLDSLIEFGINQLLERWYEMCNIAYESCPIFMSEKSFVDVSRYILSSMNTKTKKLFIKIKDNNIDILSGHSKKVIDKNLSNARLEIVSNVIKYSPREIEIFTESECEAVTFLKKVYEDRCKIIRTNS